MATPTPRHAVSLCTLLLDSSLPINHPCVHLLSSSLSLPLHCAGSHSPASHCLCWRVPFALVVPSTLTLDRAPTAGDGMALSLALDRIGELESGALFRRCLRDASRAHVSARPFSVRAAPCHPSCSSCSLTRAHGITLFSSTRLRVYIKRPLGSSAFSLGTLSELRTPTVEIPLLNQVPAQRLS